MKFSFTMMPKFSREDVLVWGMVCIVLLGIACILLAGYLFYDTAIREPSTVVPSKKPELLTSSELDNAIHILNQRQTQLNTLLGK